MAYRRLPHWAAVAVAVFIVSMAVNCLSEETVVDRRCTIDAAAIFSTPAGQDRSNFNHGGWGFQAGGGFRVKRPAEAKYAWYLTFNYLYNKFRVRESALVETIGKEPQLKGATSAHGDFSGITFDPTFRWILNQHSSLYWSGGFGWLHRGIGFNGLSKVPPLLPSSSSLGGATSNSGVVDFGMGVNYAPKSFRGLVLFTEARVYHGTAINSGSTLVPISFGVRW